MTSLKLTKVRFVALAAAGLVVALVAALLLGRSVGGDPRDPFADSRPPAGLAERFYPPENWAWGLIELGDAPVQRYGVAAPAVTARADVLILPDYGESAETWFETARDLNSAGYAVWVLEGVGQGGSGRLSSHRDLGQLKSFDADVAAVGYMVDNVIRPQPRRPLIVLGEGVGALVAARTFESGANASALILSNPACVGGLPGGTLTQIGLGEARAPGAEGWRRDGPDDFAAHRTHDRWRGAVTHAWQVLNPDLRLGGPSLDWRAALFALQGAVARDAPRIRVPTLMLAPADTRSCLAPLGAATIVIAGASPALELEDDSRRAPWLEAVRAFVAQAAALADPLASGRMPPR